MRSLAALGLALALLPRGARGEPAVVEVQAIGRTSALRAFEPNGARHVARDDRGRVHAVFTDGEQVFYRMGSAGADGRVAFDPPERLSDGSSRVLVLEHAGMPASRGAVMALHDGGSGVVVDVAWVTEGREVVARRVEPDRPGPLLGPIADTGVVGQLPVLEADSTGRLHLLVEHAFVEAGDSSEIRHATSADGLDWEADVVESAAETGSQSCRLPCAAVDLRDRLHVVFQADGFRGNGGAPGAAWWAARHSVRRDGAFEAQSGPLEAFAEWGPPAPGRALLFAYCALAVEADGDLLLAWHGTARSGAYGLDDVFLSTSAYDAEADRFGPWSRPLPLHRRVHDDVPGGPVEPGGDDELHSWVPSLAADPTTGEVFVVVMFGAFDDEIGPADTSTATEAGLVSVLDGVPSLALVSLSDSPGERNWYPNAAPRVFRDPATGARSLDVLWVAGVQDPADPRARSYEVAHALVELGGPSPARAPAGDRDRGAEPPRTERGPTGCSAAGRGRAALVVASLAPIALLARRRSRRGPAPGARQPQAGPPSRPAPRPRSTSGSPRSGSPAAAGSGSSGSRSAIRRRAAS